MFHFFDTVDFTVCDPIFWITTVVLSVSCDLRIHICQLDVIRFFGSSYCSNLLGVYVCATDVHISCG